VRTLFALYARHANISTVAKEATLLGLRSKRHLFRSGRAQGGNLFSNGQIHKLLTNPVCLGRIRHNRRSHGMALRNQLLLERIRVFGRPASSLLVHIKSPIIARPNRQPRATNDSSNQAKIEGVPLVLTIRLLLATLLSNL
jgi:hypothetical protein